MTEEMRKLRNLIQDNIDVLQAKFNKVPLAPKERGLYDAYDNVLRAIDGETVHMKACKRRIEQSTP